MNATKVTKMDVQVEEQPASKKRKKVVEISFENESKKRFLISSEKVEEKKTCRRHFETNNSKKVNNARLLNWFKALNSAGYSDPPVWGDSCG